jgi:hypothetical protein
MSKKAFRPPRLAPLQRVVAEPITDPAELAALHKAHKQHKRKQKGRQATKNRNGVRNARRTKTESR